MADKIRFELVSPERLLMSTQADMVVVPGTAGEFGVMAGHVPLVSTIRPGIVEVHDGGSVAKLYVRGGFAEVAADVLTVLAEEAVALADLTAAEVEQTLRNLSEDIADAKDPEAKAKAQAEHDRWKLIREALAA
ncbi:MAG: F0F1 ATP synthase subunit epsilon [Proteobacteria bacterium]|jgi:F-type H+-transporting ATPase subunit epsilon|nr:MAG: F0F1 ATP synthase subunit epsilon [Pseudomonadota bacterium]